MTARRRSVLKTAVVLGKSVKRFFKSLKKVLKSRKKSVKRKRRPIPGYKVRKPNRSIPKRRPVKVKKIKRPAASKISAAPAGILIGEITHFFSKISVVVLKTTHGSINAGDQIEIRGDSTRFSQKVESLQIENEDVKTAGKGKLVGLKTLRPAKPGDRVYRL